MKIYINPPKYTHEFEKGIGYEGTVWIDNGWEKISLSAYNEKGDLIEHQETKFIKQSSLFANYRNIRSIIKKEKKIHKALEKYYKKNIFFISVTDSWILIENKTINRGH